MIAEDGTLSFDLQAIARLEVRLRALHWDALTKGDQRAAIRCERAANGEIGALIWALDSLFPLQPTYADPNEDTVPNRVSPTVEMTDPIRISVTPARSSQRRKAVDR